MTNVLLSSMFRNCAPYLPQYWEQVGKLKNELELRDYTLSLLLAEGDSKDNSWYILSHPPFDIELTLIKREHGGPEFGSTNNVERWKNISFVCNGILETVSANAEIFVWIESDLIWEADTIISLINKLQYADVVVPMCFHNGTKVYYDLWGCRLGGQEIGAVYPYSPILQGISFNHGLYQIDSAGSCLVMDAEVARQTRYAYPEKGIIGWCDNIYDKGYKIWLDPSLAVYHP